MIVGGGYTGKAETASTRDHSPATSAGLSCAREFSDAFPQMRIGLFERDFVGFGASGRNTGYANAGVGHSLPDDLLSRFGENNVTTTHFGAPLINDTVCFILLRHAQRYNWVMRQWTIY